MQWSSAYTVSNMEEGTLINLIVIGHIPEWLQGTLIRNGPGQFELKHQMLNSWLDGMAKLHAISFNKGKAIYTRKFIKSEEFIKSNIQGAIAFEEFATNSSHPILHKIISLIFPQLSDNCAVNVIKAGEQYLVLSETARARIAVDPLTLNTLHHFHFNDSIKEHLSTGHLTYLPEEKVFYGFSTEFSLKPKYKVFRFSDTNFKREVLCEIPRHRPSYMHSFAVSHNYICLTENPVFLNPLRIIFSSKPLKELLVFDKHNYSCFTIINKITKKIISIKTSPFFVFHHINLVEKDQSLCIDLIEHQGLSFLKAMDIKLLKHNHIRYNPGGKLVRYKLSLTTSEVKREVLLNAHLELGVINNSYIGKDYQFIYILNASQKDMPYNQIVKFDVRNKYEHYLWEEKECYPSEPVFIQSRDGVYEDQGILMSFIVDIKNKNSFVLMLNAENFVEIGRIIIPEIIPFGAHGGFYH